MAPLKPRSPLIGKLDRLEDEVRIHEAAIRLMGPEECSSMPEMRARLERLRTLLKALRRHMHLK
jgi:flagellar biosynthesis/type III secretory pathway chaperone